MGDATALREQAEAIAADQPVVEWRHPNLAAALVAALKDLTTVEKGRTANAGTYSYGYADLGDIVKVCRGRRSRCTGSSRCNCSATTGRTRR